MKIFKALLMLLVTVSIAVSSIYGYYDLCVYGGEEAFGILKYDKDYTLEYISGYDNYSYPVFDFAKLKEAEDEVVEAFNIYEYSEEKRIHTGWYYPYGNELYESSWHMEPPAIVEKNNDVKIVPVSMTEKYRYEGWNVKEYNLGLYTLGEEIKDYIKKKDGKYGIYVKNLKTGQTLILNDNQYSSASIIKMFVMAGIYSEINKGNVEKTPTVERFLKAMITVSDNYASNYLVKVMGNSNYLSGFTKENDFSHSVGCLNTNHHSLFIGYGDYVTYGTNTVSPLDCGIMLEKIYNKTLINEELSEEMLSLLKKQTRRNKIPYYLPKGVLCANKTGETSTVQSDVGIVFSPACDYIICVITNKARSGIEDVRNISKITYEYFNK